MHAAEALITIAIADFAGPRARAATLATLEHHTDEPHTTILLSDPALNIPAALNRLLTTCTTPYILLLESGSLVTPGWLARLLAVFDDPTVGICGPSTNWCWNEQGQLPHGIGHDWSYERINAYAAELATLHGNAIQPLNTLHSLADFCYLFKRDLATKLGGFDQHYGAGPCWEIDFNTRAARAGFAGVWVKGAYVHRAPPAAWRLQAERRLFPANKQRYQDRFCGLRLRGEKHSYEPHCRGEACEHFAPAQYIQLYLPPTSQPQQTTRDAQRSHVPRVDSSNEPPLVSCIMPTRNRADFVLQSIRYFQRQTYPNRELLIIDDGDDGLEQRLPADPRIRYLHVAAGMSIGAKRNLACTHAYGAIIAQWDDDDWYGPMRLEQQIAPLISGTATITGLITGAIFELPQWQFWRCSAAIHRRMFFGDVHGGTLTYWRNIWEHDGHYPDRSLAEDAMFLRMALRRGARLERVPGDALFIYIRHGRNSWAFPCGQFIDPAGWQPIGEPDQLLADRAFFAAHSTVQTSTQQARHSPPTTQPLISCIMPTKNRRAFVPHAIRYFLRQDYEAKELIILDDSDDPVEDLIPADPQIRYVRLARRMTLGAKRNHCVELARGDFILHWDDDDWYAPQRISLQFARLRETGAEICGLRQMLFFEPATHATWLYSYPQHARPWLAGGSLLYSRAFWKRSPFPEVATGEDTRFVWQQTLAYGAVVADYTWYVANIHSANTSPKQRTGACWRRWPGDIGSILGQDYQQMCRALISIPH